MPERGIAIEDRAHLRGLTRRCGRTRCSSDPPLSSPSSFSSLSSSPAAAAPQQPTGRRRRGGPFAAAWRCLPSQQRRGRSSSGRPGRTSVSPACVEKRVVVWKSMFRLTFRLTTVYWLCLIRKRILKYELIGKHTLAAAVAAAADPPWGAPPRRWPWTPPPRPRRPWPSALARLRGAAAAGASCRPCVKQKDAAFAGHTHLDKAIAFGRLISTNKHTLLAV